VLIYLALGFVLLGIVLGGAGMRRLGRLAHGAWRPGAGILALAAFVGAAILAIREAVAPAIGLFLLGIWLSLSVRRTARTRHTPPPPQSAEVQAAADILGVAPDAADGEVQEAYRRLIRMAHPDQGGTSGLAAQLNAARDTLLRRR
jgi:hypothetical protein